MTNRQWLIALVAALYQRWRDHRRWQRLRNQPFASVEETIVLSWLTSMYARYGPDEKLDACYTKWHFGVWPHQLPNDLRPEGRRRHG